MSLEAIKGEVRRFIRDSRSDLLVLRGRWGVGKTFFWQNLVKEAGAAHSFGREYYGYVSLFGVADLEALKNLILVSIGFASDIAKSAEKSFNIKKVMKDIERLPKVREWTGGLASEVAFLAIRDALICFDDLERKGGGLDFKDIFGLVSILKGQKNCKIILILNEDTLSEADRESFRRHGEKLVDVSLEFFQTPENAFDTGFVSQVPWREFLRDRCMVLGIVNIRILQRLDRFVQGIGALLSICEEVVVRDVLSSMVLFVWCFYNKDGVAPSLEYLTSQEFHRFFLDRNKNQKSPEREWNVLLRDYGYTHTSDFDVLLADYVRRGYFEAEAMGAKLHDMNQAAKKSSGKEYYRKAWHLYLDSFDDNEGEFLGALLEGFIDNINYMSIQELNEVVLTLRQFDADASADKLIDDYLVRYRTELSRPNVHSEFVFSAPDPSLRQKLDELLAAMPDTRTLEAVVKKVTASNSWNFEDEEFMATAGADSFYKFFKSVRSGDLRTWVKRCLNFGQPGNSERGKLIAAHARDALLRIASENRINRNRIETLYGITLDSEDAGKEKASSEKGG